MKETKYTLFGLIALIIWSTTPAFSRAATETLGTFTTAGCTYLVAGLLAAAYQIWVGHGLAVYRRISRRYWLTCGVFYLLYIACSYLSISIAATREQVMVVVLIKFLWPLWTMLLTIMVLKNHASPWLAGGVLLSLAGIVIANLGGQVNDVATFWQNLRGNLWPFLIALVAAFSWAFYSVFSRKLAGDSDGGVGFFILATGVLLSLVSLFMPEARHWTWRAVGQVAYLAVFTAFIGTLLWDAAMRRGKIVLVAITSNFLPLITVLATGALFGITPGLPVWIGAGLVVVGTMWSKRSFDAGASKPAVVQAQAEGDAR